MNDPDTSVGGLRLRGDHDRPCSKCGKCPPEAKFGVYKTGPKAGCRKPRCNGCKHDYHKIYTQQTYVKEYYKQYRAANVDHIKEYYHKYVQDNSEKIASKNKRYYSKHENENRERRRRYYQENREKLVKDSRNYYNSYVAPVLKAKSEERRRKLIEEHLEKYGAEIAAFSEKYGIDILAKKD